jgi:uncharacterized repeat protein (TIGR03803 family)
MTLAMLGGLAVSTALADGYQTLFTFPNNVQLGGNLLDIDSTLYGTTRDTAFSVAVDGSNFQTLHQLDTTTEGSMFLSLTEVGSKLYGVTQYASPTNPGKVLSMALDGSDSQVLSSFPSNSDAPLSPLTLLGSQLFGVYANGSSVLSLNVDGSNLQTIHAFNGTDGDFPHGPLLAVGSTLYGTTSAGGQNNVGVIYSVSPNGQNFQVLHQFDATGNQSYTGLVQIGSQLFGTTNAGGVPLASDGTIFSMNLDGSNYQMLHSFADFGTAGYQLGNLVHSGSLLVGTVSTGGPTGDGLIFSMNSDGSNYQVLHNFTGYNPAGYLAVDGSTVYGYANPDSGSGGGILFSVTVPEPSSLALGLLALTIGIAWRGNVSKEKSAKETNSS